MNAENYIKAQLVSFAASEGLRYGGTDTALAIARVMANRVRAGWCGGDWLAVIAAAPESAGTAHEASGVMNPRETNLRLLLQRIENVYHDVGDDLTHGALYYAQLDLPVLPWFRDNILGDPEAHPMLASFGTVYFFG